MLAADTSDPADSIAGQQHLGDQRIVMVRRPEYLTFHRTGASRRFYAILGGAVLAGVACGLAAVSLVHPSRTVWVSKPVSDLKITQTVVPVTYQQVATGNAGSASTVRTMPSRADAALQEVRIRNRRLEALVKVLRQRSSGESQSRTRQVN